MFTIRPIILTLVWFSILTSSRSTAAADPLVVAAKRDIVGEWEMQYTAPWNSLYSVLQRATYSPDGTASGTYSLLRNSNRKDVVYEISWKSRYILESPIPALNAVAIRFEAISKTAKIVTRDAVLLSQSGVYECKLKPEVIIDFAKVSCPEISKSIPECPTEYEIAKVTPTELRFGFAKEGVDNCKQGGRPTALDLAAFRKIRR